MNSNNGIPPLIDLKENTFNSSEIINQQLDEKIRMLQREILLKKQNLLNENNVHNQQQHQYHLQHQHHQPQQVPRDNYYVQLNENYMRPEIQGEFHHRRGNNRYNRGPNNNNNNNNLNFHDRFENRPFNNNNNNNRGRHYHRQFNNQNHRQQHGNNNRNNNRENHQTPQSPATEEKTPKQLDNDQEQLKKLQDGISELKLLLETNVDDNDVNDVDVVGKNDDNNQKNVAPNKRRPRQRNNGKNNGGRGNQNKRNDKDVGDKTTTPDDDNNKNQFNHKNRLHENIGPYRQQHHQFRNQRKLNTNKQTNTIINNTFMNDPFLKNIDLYRNNTIRMCLKCSITLNINEGIVLGKCSHTFCIKCLTKFIEEQSNIIGGGGDGNIFCPIIKGTVQCTNILKTIQLQTNNDVNKEKLNIEKANDTNNKPTEPNKKGAIPKRMASIHPIIDKYLNLYPNREQINCERCHVIFQSNKGVVVQICMHKFCIKCLVKTITDDELSTKDNRIFCPFKDERGRCKNLLKKKNDETTTPVKLEKFNCYDLTCNEMLTIKITADNQNKTIICPKCISSNCFQCKAIHFGMTCDEYKLFKNSNTTKWSCKNCETLNETNLIICTKCKKHINDKKPQDELTQKFKHINDKKPQDELTQKFNKMEEELKLLKNFKENLDREIEIGIENKLKLINDKKTQDALSQNYNKTEQMLRQNFTKDIHHQTAIKNNVPIKKWRCFYCDYDNPTTMTCCQMCYQNKIIKEIEEKFEHLKWEESNNVVFKTTAIIFCVLCKKTPIAGESYKLKSCHHEFCKKCLTIIIQLNKKPEVECPAKNCGIVIPEFEIRNIVPRDVYEDYVKKLGQLAKNAKDVFNCKTPKCHGHWICLDKSLQYECPICHKNNCIPCNAIHFGLTCQQYKNHNLGRLNTPPIDLFKFETPIKPCKKCGEMLINMDQQQHVCPKDTFFNRIVDLFSAKK